MVSVQSRDSVAGILCAPRQLMCRWRHIRGSRLPRYWMNLGSWMRTASTADNRERKLRRIAFCTIALAVFHLAAETFYTLRYGQTALGYLPDVVAVGLLLVGSVEALKDWEARGVLCGAWGFTCCLHYRAWAWRVEASLSETINPADDFLATVLGTTLIISIGFFIAMLRLCFPKQKKTGLG